MIDVLKSKTLVSDGAMGTMLQENGLLAGQCPEEMIDIMEEFREHTKLPLIAQVNVGLPETIESNLKNILQFSLKCGCNN